VTAPLAPDVSADSALVLAARAGDRTALGELYLRYARMVHGILLAKVPAGEVEDLVQDVFLKALPRLRELRDVSRFGPWLAAITRNRAHDYHRQARTRPVLTESFEEEHEEHVSTSHQASDAEAAMILEIVRSLPEAYRETLILRLVEGMTGPEIAARTGLTPGSVRVNLHRGMQQLREKLAQASTRHSLQSESRAGSIASRLKNSLRRRNEP
jgi:RNA polymerase sigma-70 factor, ECF subfamily